MRFDSKVVVVTGAGGGIGSATAEAFARAGASLLLVDANEADLARVTAVVAAECDGRVVSVVADVTDAASVDAYFGRAEEELGGVDVLFNNAGIEGSVAPLVETDDADFDRVLAVNVRGVWLNLKAAARAMRAHGRGGSIVNTGSGASLVGSPGLTPYVASKHAVLGLTRSAALELAAERIRVNAVCPGPVDTQMMERITELAMPGDSGARGMIEAGVPAGRYAAPAEIARAVLFLASDDASYVTGAALSVDGGFTAQ